MERTLESVSFQEDTSSLTAIAHEWQETRRATAKNAGSASSLVASSASSEPSAATAVEEDDAQQLRSTSPVKRRRASRSSTSTSNSEDSTCNLLERGMVVDSNGNLCVWWLAPCTHMYRWLPRLIFITVIGPRVDGWMVGWLNGPCCVILRYQPAQGRCRTPSTLLCMQARPSTSATSP